MKNICRNCWFFKDGGIRRDDLCRHPTFVTVEIQNEVYGGVTSPKVMDARKKCRGLKFTPKMRWIERIWK